MRPGEESVRAETGKQTVWPVAVSSGLVDMCAHHKTIHEGHSNLANQIAAQTGLAQEEHEELSAHTGTCVECKRRAGKGELARSLETLMPPGHMRERNERDPGYQTPRMGPRGPQARPRKPDWTPGGTKPFAPLRQSENALGDTTDWDAHYDALPDTVHRGYSMGVPNKLYDAIHDPQADQAHVAKEIIARTGRRATGTHWSADLGTARGFATGSLPTGGSHIALVLHGQRPDREDIETRPAMLKRMEIFDHAGGAHEEREVPVRKGRMVQVTGVSWKPHEEHPAADEQGWVRHDFSTPMLHKASEETRPLPEKLYHVTTARDAVLEHGMKTRSELGQQYGHGLGGGRDDTISLTSHRPTAEHLLHSLHEYHDVLNGRIKLADLKEKARQGVGAEKPYDYMLKDHADEDLAAADKGRAIEHRMHDRSEVGEGWKPLDEGMHGTGPKGEYHLHMAWDRPLDRSELLRKRDDVYKKFSWGRQGAGGHLDPLFIANDPGEFAKKDPGQFALLHVRSRPGAHGIQMNDRSEGTDAGEWRALSGKDLDVVHHESRDDITPRTAAKYPIKYTRMTQNGYEDVEDEIEGPLYHGSRSKSLQPGDMITKGRKTNPWGDQGPKSQTVHFTVHHDTARDYADQAGGHVYEVEPTGEFKHDYSGGDFKTVHPLRVVRMVPRSEWEQSKTAATLPDDHPDKVYLRFGHWPKDERSQNNVTGWKEEGVSVYDLDHHGEPVDPDAGLNRYHEHDEHCEGDCDLDQWNDDYGNDTGEEMNGRVNRAETNRRRGREFAGDTGHLVKGKMVGVGHDGEPLLKNVRRVGDWIDHRHLLIPGAERHRLARDPYDEDYEPPKQNKTTRTAMTPERRAEIERIREERRNRPRRPAGQQRADAFSHLFTPIPEEELAAQRKAAEPKPEPINDKTYSIGDVDKHYEWEGFDPYEIEHLVHHPEHAQFTHEDVPVHSLRHITEHGELVKPPSYRDIADQGDDEQERLGELERGHDDGAHIPPIVVVRDGEHHIIADGSHRTAIAAERGHTHIPAFVTPRTIMPKTGHMAEGGPDPFERTAAMHNPNAKAGQAEDEWYHGSPHDFDSFGDTGSSNDTEDHVNHWNVLLGNHFTATHNVAHDFSLGLHHASDANGNDDAEEPLGHVIHARLHIKRPKVYASEHDMDQEVHEHEVKRGNLLDHHLPEPPHEDADEGEWDDYYDDAGNARVYRGDSNGPFHKDEPDPNVAYGFHPKATGWLNHHPDKEGIAARFKDRLIQQGHDGIVYGNEFERADGGGKEKSAIAFHPDQIEITQHHYGRTGQCLNPADCARQKRSPMPGQLELPTHTSARSVGTGRLATPLPQACWDRFHEPPATDWPTAKDIEDENMHTASTNWLGGIEGPNGEPTEYPGNGIKQVRHSADMPVPLYHGTSAKFEPGDLISPGHPGNFVRRMKHVYAVEDPEHAQRYGWHGLGSDWDKTKGNEQERHPRVYEVRPTGPYGHRSDARGQNWASEEPLQVVREVWHHEPKEHTAMRREAHDSGDGQRIFHCPFCGAGQVIARSDGTTECEFCHQAFTVQVQPQFNSFPQTDPTTGLPIMIPGMPGQIDAPGTPPGAPGGALPPGADEESDNPFVADSGDESGPPGADDGGDDSGDDGDDNKPDFLKGSSFRTAAGDLLTEEAYARHLALRFSADPEKMIASLRSAR